jgi:hypothetical protein
MTDYNTTIIEEFRANRGRVGGMWEGTMLVLLHHIGAKSGIERVTPVACSPRGDGRFAIWAARSPPSCPPGQQAWPFNSTGDTHERTITGSVHRG